MQAAGQTSGPRGALSDTPGADLAGTRVGGQAVGASGAPAGGMSQARLAALAGADRSTISALLGSDQPRLPNAHLVAEIARVLGVSSDWLLGLSDSPDSLGVILSRSLEVRAASRDPVDQQIERWHAQAHGTKIRNVPASLPAFTKTGAVLAIEYGEAARNPNHDRSAGRASGRLIDRDDAVLSRMVEHHDLELAMPRQRLEALVAREGPWRALSHQEVARQLDRLRQLHENHYPRVRIHLYDEAQHYSAPITVFGAQRAVIYLGRSYFAFTTRDHIDELTAQFDALVRDAAVEAHAFGGFLERLGRG